jgi:hypothetical protein
MVSHNFAIIAKNAGIEGEKQTGTFLTPEFDVTTLKT